jgi:hypothetical protein
MKRPRFYMPCLLAAALSVGSLAETSGAETAKESVDLRVGAKAPTFIVHDDEGRSSMWRITSARKSSSYSSSRLH